MFNLRHWLGSRSRNSNSNASQPQEPPTNASNLSNTQGLPEDDGEEVVIRDAFTGHTLDAATREHYAAFINEHQRSHSSARTDTRDSPLPVISPFSHGSEGFVITSPPSDLGTANTHTAHTTHITNHFPGATPSSSDYHAFLSPTETSIRPSSGVSAPASTSFPFPDPGTTPPSPILPRHVPCDVLQYPSSPPLAPDMDDFFLPDHLISPPLPGATLFPSPSSPSPSPSPAPSPAASLASTRLTPSSSPILTSAPIPVPVPVPVRGVPLAPHSFAAPDAADAEDLGFLSVSMHAHGHTDAHALAQSGSFHAHAHFAPLHTRNTPTHPHTHPHGAYLGEGSSPPLQPAPLHAHPSVTVGVSLGARGDYALASAGALPCFLCQEHRHMTRGYCAACAWREALAPHVRQLRAVEDAAARAYAEAERLLLEAEAIVVSATEVEPDMRAETERGGGVGVDAGGVADLAARDMGDLEVVGAEYSLLLQRALAELSVGDLGDGTFPFAVEAHFPALSHAERTLLLRAWERRVQEAVDEEERLLAAETAEVDGAVQALVEVYGAAGVARAATQAGALEILALIGTEGECDTEGKKGAEKNSERAGVSAVGVDVSAARLRGERGRRSRPNKDVQVGAVGTALETSQTAALSLWADVCDGEALRKAALCATLGGPGYADQAEAHAAALHAHARAQLVALRGPTGDSGVVEDGGTGGVEEARAYAATAVAAAAVAVEIVPAPPPRGDTATDAATDTLAPHSSSSSVTTHAPSAQMSLWRGYGRRARALSSLIDAAVTVLAPDHASAYADAHQQLVHRLNAVNVGAGCSVDSLGAADGGAAAVSGTGSAIDVTPAALLAHLRAIPLPASPALYPPSVDLARAALSPALLPTPDPSTAQSATQSTAQSPAAPALTDSALAVLGRWLQYTNNALRLRPVPTLPLGALPAALAMTLPVLPAAVPPPLPFSLAQAGPLLMIATTTRPHSQLFRAATLASAYHPALALAYARRRRAAHTLLPRDGMRDGGIESSTALLSVSDHPPTLLLPHGVSLPWMHSIDAHHAPPALPPLPYMRLHAPASTPAPAADTSASASASVEPHLHARGGRGYTPGEFLSQVLCAQLSAPMAAFLSGLPLPAHWMLLQGEGPLLLSNGWYPHLTDIAPIADRLPRANARAPPRTPAPAVTARAALPPASSFATAPVATLPSSTPASRALGDGARAVHTSEGVRVMRVAEYRGFSTAPARPAISLSSSLSSSASAAAPTTTAHMSDTTCAPSTNALVAATTATTATALAYCPSATLSPSPSSLPSTPAPARAPALPYALTAPELSGGSRGFLPLHTALALLPLSGMGVSMGMSVSACQAANIRPDDTVAAVATASATTLGTQLIESSSYSTSAWDPMAGQLFDPGVRIWPRWVTLAPPPAVFSAHTAENTVSAVTASGVRPGVTTSAAASTTTTGATPASACASGTCASGSSAASIRTSSPCLSGMCAEWCVDCMPCSECAWAVCQPVLEPIHDDTPLTHTSAHTDTHAQSGEVQLGRTHEPALEGGTEAGQERAGVGLGVDREEVATDAHGAALGAVAVSPQQSAVAAASHAPVQHGGESTATDMGTGVAAGAGPSAGTGMGVGVGLAGLALVTDAPRAVMVSPLPSATSTASAPTPTLASPPTTAAFASPFSPSPAIMASPSLTMRTPVLTPAPGFFVAAGPRVDLRRATQQHAAALTQRILSPSPVSPAFPGSSPAHTSPAPLPALPMPSLSPFASPAPPASAPAAVFPLLSRGSRADASYYARRGRLPPPSGSAVATPASPAPPTASPARPGAPRAEAEHLSLLSGPAEPRALWTTARSCPHANTSAVVKSLRRQDKHDPAQARSGPFRSPPHFRALLLGNVHALLHWAADLNAQLARVLSVLLPRSHAHAHAPCAQVSLAQLLPAALHSMHATHTGALATCDPRRPSRCADALLRELSLAACLLRWVAMEMAAEEARWATGRKTGSYSVEGVDGADVSVHETLNLLRLAAGDA